MLGERGGLRHMLTWRQGTSLKAAGQSDVYPCHHSPLSLNEGESAARRPRPEQYDFWQLLTHIMKGQ